eukprot:2059080-Prorocentrum_lima.AAC.1
MGAQGQPWRLHFVQEARKNHKEWLDMTSREGNIGSQVCSWTTISHSTNGNQARINPKSGYP